ncbi:MAG TPA: hypothetical protein VMC06_09500 [Opitutaceae bacterium]|nr:hypothetical protein [Opitutaceae bacterium]
MNSCTHTLLTGLGRLVRCLTLVLLPALVAEGGQTGSTYAGPAGAPPESSPESSHPYSAPYLAVVGPPPMRFREPPAPPSFELEPVAMGPAQLEETLPVSPPSSVAAGGRFDSSSPKAASQKSSTKSPASSPTANRPEDNEPSSILPDDLHRDVRPEDLLPYFQYPRNGGAVIGVPAPAQPTLPPSSATYRQQ